MYQNILTTKSGVIQCYQCVGFFSLPPANEVCEGYVFTGVCLSTPGGACMVLFGGACVVLFGGHAWFYSGGVCGFIWGVCMVLFGGEPCMVFPGGGMHGFFSFFQIQ